MNVLRCQLMDRPFSHGLHIHFLWQRFCCCYSSSSSSSSSASSGSSASSASYSGRNEIMIKNEFRCYSNEREVMRAIGTVAEGTGASSRIRKHRKGSSGWLPVEWTSGSSSALPRDRYYSTDCRRAFHWRRAVAPWILFHLLRADDFNSAAQFQFQFNANAAKLRQETVDAGCQ